MTQSGQDSLLANIQEWLEPGEELIEYSVGALQDATFDTVVALTSRYIRLGGLAGGRTIPLDRVRYVEWKGLWARLNIGTASPKERLVIAVNGREWKQRAAKLAAAWLQRGASKGK